MDDDLYINVIIECCNKIGWDVGYQEIDDEQEVKGLVIGESPFVGYIMKHLDT